MNRLIEKPQFIFLLAIPIIILIGIISGDEMLSINVHDTYYVISYLHLTVLISILFGIFGIGYWIIQKADRKLSKWMTYTHIIVTFVGVLIVWILTKFYRTDFMEYQFNNILTSVINIVLLIIIFGQLIFPINIIYGLTKNKNKTCG